MKKIRIECENDFFEELEAFMFSESFGKKPDIDGIEVILENGDIYNYAFEESFGAVYIVTR